MFGRRMMERSKRLGRDRDVGFTPVRNGRHDLAIQQRFLMIQMTDPMHPAEAQAEAVRQFARTLPMGRMVKRYAGAGLTAEAIAEVRRNGGRRFRALSL